ncbi:MAG: bifunctional aspartate kinase/diaminopimelate decarboxylase [Candidatus Coatesbacteria bacterium]|nr:bifunctional aspartate kinase/diaminopimelate decarboxylase [Candidatus Coatesbacteria bacterium]
MNKTNKWIVLKFGGTSVASRENWEVIASVIKKRILDGYKVVAVFSAITGISNKLEDLLEEALKGKFKDSLNIIRNEHENLSEQLDIELDEKISNDFECLSRLSLGVSLIGEVSPRLKAQFLSFGELMLTRIGFSFLQKTGIKSKWIDIRDFLVSEDEYSNDFSRYLSACCDYSHDEAFVNCLNLMNTDLVVCQGFIASNSLKETVLLGRGGSDVSASYIAAKIGALHLEIWTDVPGMYTADPRQIPESLLIKFLSFEEAQEISAMGAKVLHPRCISPARRYKIPLRIFCTQNPEIEGTIITSEGESSASQVKAISLKYDIILVSMESIVMWQQSGFLSDIFNCFKKYGISIDLVSTSETNVTVSLDQRANSMEHLIDFLVADLNKFCKVRIIAPCASVSLVGKNIRSILHKIGHTLEVFEEQKIYLVTQASNDLNLTFVVDEDQAERLAGLLHELLFRERKNDRYFGKTWRELFAEEESKELYNQPDWWLKKREEIIDIAGKGTPVYIYDEETLEDVINEVSSLKNVDEVFYSVKANWHKDILGKVYDAGFGFECVSEGEIRHVIEIFKGINPERILFTPNFVARSEYEFAFMHKVNVTIDNLYPLEKWGDLFHDKKIILRIDPGEGHGHHKYVHTAGLMSKFGIPRSQLAELFKLIRSKQLKIKGLHAHSGSGILSHEVWSKTAVFLSSVAEEIGDVEILDLGGGFGVPEKPGQKPLDLVSLDESFSKFKRAYPDYKIWIEPGRFIVARCCALITKVTQIKTKGEICYIGVDAGMNSLIRPALYGSYHEIMNLSKADIQPTLSANIVGPICESGDTLGYSRYIAPSEEGDLILIGTTGAYGRAMSSTYNLREPARECFIYKK